MLRARHVALAALLVALHACSGDSDLTGVPPDSDAAPSSAISDGANPPGLVGFYFLPPLVPPPTFAGQFDPNQTPVVRIVCTGASDAQCPILRTASVRVDPNAEQYVATWKTPGRPDRTAELGPDRYRIEVLIGETLVGFADLWFVAKSPELRSVPSGYIGMVAGRIPDVPFRIETGLISQNNAPVAQDDQYETDHETELSGNVLDNDSDPDGDALSAVLGAGPAHGSLTLSSDGSFSYTPNAGYSGVDGFSYRASDGQLQSSEATVAITVNPPKGLRFRAVSSGHGRHVCALTRDGSAYCWGPNERGQLGDGTTENRLRPTKVLQATGVSFTQITTGVVHTCALTARGQAYCWGDNVVGQLGSLPALTAVPVSVPRAVEQSGLSYVAIEAHDDKTCALDADGAAYCWGSNADGLLGVGVVPLAPLLETLYITRPRAVVQPPGVIFRSLTGYVTQSCGLATTGQAYCWGVNLQGELGDGTTEDRVAPTPVVQAVGVTFSAIDAGLAQTCGVTPLGTGYCWGLISNGSFGNGDFSGNALTPTEAATSSGPWQSIQVGGAFACGINTSGRVFCWGSPGRLGIGQLQHSAVPAEVQLPPGQRFVSVATGGIAACALSEADELFCWGHNNDGSIGDGTTIDRLSPVRIE